MSETAAGPPARHEERLATLLAELEGLAAATFLVSNPVNIAYLTGFESSNAVVLAAPDRTLLLTDGRYVEAARGIGGVQAVHAERDLAAYLGRRLAELVEPPVAFESNHLTYAAYDAIAAAGVELRPVAGVLEELRSVKDADELAAIGRAAAVTDRAFERLAGEALVGRSEREVAWWLERALHDAGADAPAFPVIVASGPNAALPHHHPGGRRLQAGDTVIVDAGARVDGYCADCTRTYAAGELPDELADAYDVCRDAQQGALAAVVAGAPASEVDAVARRRIAGAGYDVLHGLGHGVGREVHELPRLADTSDAVLAPGNVVTVEPGIYLPGQGGIRIEDLVVVTADGPQVLTPASKDLIALT